MDDIEIIIEHDDFYLMEAKSYTVDNAKKYGLEKAIIMNTLRFLKKFKIDDVLKYFPEFDSENVKKHLNELMKLGLIK